MKAIKHYNDFSVSAEKLKEYQNMPMEKRLEWLYLGNILRKAFCEKMDDVMPDGGQQQEDRV